MGWDRNAPPNRHDSTTQDGPVRRGMRETPLSRWRHGFEPRWDYKQKARSEVLSSLGRESTSSAVPHLSRGRPRHVTPPPGIGAVTAEPPARSPSRHHLADRPSDAPPQPRSRSKPCRGKALHPNTRQPTRDASAPILETRQTPIPPKHRHAADRQTISQPAGLTVMSSRISAMTGTETPLPA